MKACASANSRFRYRTLSAPIVVALLVACNAWATTPPEVRELENYVKEFSEDEVTSQMRLSFARRNSPRLKLLIPSVWPVDYELDGLPLLYHAISNELVDIVEYLLSEGANPESVFSDRRMSVLNLAVSRSFNPAVEMLLEYGADVESSFGSPHPLWPMRIAVNNRDVEVLSMLIQAGADVDRVGSRNGQTALHLAVLRGHEPMIKLLIEAGAAWQIPDANGRTALDLAGRVELLEYFSGGMAKK